MQTDASLVLLYDGDCRICTAFARAVSRLAGRDAIRARSIQTSPALFGGMPPTTALASAHAISPDGRIRSGPDVLPALAGAFLRQPRLEDRMNASARARSATDVVYHALVAFRGALSCASAATSSEARNPR